MSFEFVRQQVINACDLLGIETAAGNKDQWTQQSVIDIFQYFYYVHDKYCSFDHPNMSQNTVNKIVANIGFYEYDYQSCKLYPSDYPDLIDGYFRQRFPNCNYSMAHFMSGNIRALRFLELM